MNTLSSYESAAENFKALCDSLSLDVKATFVPYSKSRNAGVWRSLNWDVDLIRNGRVIVSTQYSAGVGHCPADKKTFKRLGDKHLVISAEIESGYECSIPHGYVVQSSVVINPNKYDVIASFVRDNDALNYTFDEWCDYCGYNNDSVKAKGIYDTCVRHAIALRGAICLKDLEKLQEYANEM